MSNLTGIVVIPFCTVISAGSANASASSREISNDVFCCLSFDSAANVGKGNENNNVKAINNGNNFFISHALHQIRFVLESVSLLEKEKCTTKY